MERHGPFLKVTVKIPGVAGDLCQVTVGHSGLSERGTNG